MKTRKLKFRVWDKLSKVFIYPDKGYQGHYILSLDGKFYNLQNGSGGNEYIVQQFTGMFDKNGKDIYEGDVIRGYFDMGPAGMTINTAIVRWTNKEGYQWKYWDLNSIEVVGNIFENKDLVCDHTKYHMSVNGNCYNCGKLIFPKKPENGTPEHIKNIFKHNQ